MVRFFSAVFVVSALAGCDLHRSPSPVVATAPVAVAQNDWRLATPARIAGFDRGEVAAAAQPGGGVTAGYSLMIDTEAVIATIRLRPVAASGALLPGISLGGSITPGASAQALDASVAQVRRYYPKAEIVTRGPAFLYARGALQTGQTGIVDYQELHAGQQRRMRLKIYTFCCGAGQWSYEYRFRYPAMLDGEDAIAEFMRETAWSSPP